MNILCFGDSNTWGANPEGGRFARDVRWPGVLQKLMPDDYVIENGFCGRTTVFNDPLLPGRRGIDDLNSLLDIHQPLDVVIVMLGTNDSKNFFAADERVIQQGCEAVLDTIARHAWGEGVAPRLIVIAPPAIGDHIERCPYVGFDAASVSKLHKLAGLYAQSARRFNALYLDPAPITAVGPDELHMNAEAHRHLAEAVCSLLNEHRDEILHRS